MSLPIGGAVSEPRVLPQTNGWLAGARDAFSIVMGYFGVGLAAGVVEHAAGLSVAEILFLSVVLYAGSAQFILVSMLALGQSVSAIVLTVFFVNVRHVLMSAALSPYLRHLTTWQNVLLGAQLTDETFVVAIARCAREPQLSARWLGGLQLTAWMVWACANVSGAFLAGSLSQRLLQTQVLSFALPCMFAGLLVLQLQVQAVRWRGASVAILSAIVALTIAWHFPGPWAVIIATVVGATLGLLLTPTTVEPAA